MFFVFIESLRVHFLNFYFVLIFHYLGSLIDYLRVDKPLGFFEAFASIVTLLQVPLSMMWAVRLFKTNHMPIRFLLYVAITALTRLLIGDVSHHNAPDLGIIYLCGGILLLAFAILVVRFASSRYPSVKEKSES